MINTLSFYYGRPYEFKAEKITFKWDGSAAGVNMTRAGKEFFIPCKDRGRRGFEIEKDYISIDKGATGLMSFILHCTCNLSRVAINSIVDRFS